MEWQNAVMYFVGLALICLAIKKKYEPALLQKLHKGQPFFYTGYSPQKQPLQKLSPPRAFIIPSMLINARESAPISLQISATSC